MDIQTDRGHRTHHLFLIKVSDQDRSHEEHQPVLFLNQETKELAPKKAAIDADELERGSQLGPASF